jgi:hypothetical protein
VARPSQPASPVCPTKGSRSVGAPVAEGSRCAGEPNRRETLLPAEIQQELAEARSASGRRCGCRLPLHICELMHDIT